MEGWLLNGLKALAFVIRRKEVGMGYHGHGVGHLEPQAYRIANDKELK